MAKLKAVSGDSGDEWLVEPEHHHQGRLSTAGCARRGYGAAGRCEDNYGLGAAVFRLGRVIR